MSDMQYNHVKHFQKNLNIAAQKDNFALHKWMLNYKM